MDKPSHMTEHQVVTPCITYRAFHAVSRAGNVLASVPVKHFEGMKSRARILHSSPAQPGPCNGW